MLNRPNREPDFVWYEWKIWFEEQIQINDFLPSIEKFDYNQETNKYLSPEYVNSLRQAYKKYIAKQFLK